MCGIAGSVNFSLPVEEVQRMLQHRGPDEQTYWIKDNIQFVHARLAIQDLSIAGRQPMHLGQYHIVYNGEIYNHLEVRNKLNLKCNSHSDTETLLQAFDRLGLSMLDELDGMFAMALYDDVKNKLYLIRDRAGEKPLYYSLKNRSLVFASELNVLRKLLKPEISLQKVSNFLAIGYLPQCETPYHDVMELPAGHVLELDLQNFKYQVKQWWSILPFYQNQFKGNLQEAQNCVDGMLNCSVQRRLHSSDLEVGAFLSGGIDSGLVTSIASRYSSQLKTFTVSFDGMFNESCLARLTANRLGTIHQEITISLDNLEMDIEKLFQNYGEPIMDDSIIPSYYVAKEARKHLTVILNGDAGDELFGGYRRYVPFAKLNLFKGRIAPLIKPIQNFLPVPKNKMSGYNYIYRLVSLLASQGKSVYWSATNDLLNKHFNYFKLLPTIDGYVEDGILDNALSPLKKIMYLDFTNLLPTTLLVKMDIATMAFGLEGRSPFLSKELMEFVPSLPDQMKINRGSTKSLLRALGFKYLPQEILNQPKRGFEVPLNAWMNNQLRDLVNDRLNSVSTLTHQVLKPAFVKALLLNKGHNLYPDQRAKVLFACLSIECWAKG